MWPSPRTVISYTDAQPESIARPPTVGHELGIHPARLAYSQLGGWPGAATALSCGGVRLAHSGAEKFE